MSLSSVRAVLAVLTIAVAASVSPAQISNGNFTAGINPPTSVPFAQVGYNSSTSSISNWSTAGGGVDWINTYWQAPPGGGFSIDLAGSSAGSLSQSLSGLTIGRTYYLQFNLSGNPDGGPAIKTGAASLGLNSQPISFDTTSTSKTNMGWVAVQLAFTAISTSDTLTFSSTTVGSFGPAIGNVSFSPVPEPMSVGLMATAGLGLVRLVRRRSA